MSKQMISMAEICHGALNEAVAAEIDNVIENIRDPNYPAKDARKIVITLTFKPDESRSMSSVGVTTSTKLAGPAPLETVMLFERDEKGRIVATERTPVNGDHMTIPLHFAKG